MEESRSHPIHESLSLRQKIGFSFGYGLNDLISAYLWTYLLLFTEISMKLDIVYGGYIILVAQLTDAIFHPIGGILSDRFGGCCHMGRRKSWYLFGFIFEAIGLFITYGINIPEDNNPDYIRFFYYIPGILCYCISGAVVTVSHLGILVQITHSPLERVQLNGWRNAMTAVCSFIVYSTAWLLLYIDKGTNYKPQLSDRDAPAFRQMAAVVVGCGVLFSVLFFILTNEQQKNPEYIATDMTSQTCKCTRISKRDYQITNTKMHNSGSARHCSCEHQNKNAGISDTNCSENIITGIQNGQINSIHTQRKPKDKSCLDSGVFSVLENRRCCDDSIGKSSTLGVEININSNTSWIKKTLKDPEFYKVTIIYSACKVSLVISQGYIPLYVTESLGMDKVSVAVMPLIIFVSGFIASLTMKKFNKRFGRLKTLLIGEILILGACVWIYFISQNVYQQIYGASVIFGTGLATVQVTALAMISDLIGDDTAHGASMYGTIGFVEKISQGLSFVLIQNFNPCRNGISPDCIQFYRWIAVAVPGATTLLSMTIIIFAEVMKKMQNVNV